MQISGRRRTGLTVADTRSASQQDRVRAKSSEGTCLSSTVNSVLHHSSPCLPHTVTTTRIAPPMTRRKFLLASGLAEARHTHLTYCDESFTSLRPHRGNPTACSLHLVTQNVSCSILQASVSCHVGPDHTAMCALDPVRASWPPPVMVSTIEMGQGNVIIHFTHLT